MNMFGASDIMLTLKTCFFSHILTNESPVGWSRLRQVWIVMEWLLNKIHTVLIICMFELLAAPPPPFQLSMVYLGLQWQCTEVVRANRAQPTTDVTPDVNWRLDLTCRVYLLGTLHAWNGRRIPDATVTPQFKKDLNNRTPLTMRTLGRWQRPRYQKPFFFSRSHPN